MTGEKLHYLGKGRRANDGKGIVAWYTVGKTTTAINDDFSTRKESPVNGTSSSITRMMSGS